jgi:hypothetical protein
MHAILGCDTTSHIHGLGKGSALNLMCTNQVFQEQAEVFRKCKQHKTRGNRSRAQCYTLLIHKGKSGENLDFLRLHRFHQKVSGRKSCVHPPTSAAAKFHSMHVYLQVQQWMSHREHMKPDHWGWYKQSGKYLPVPIGKEEAPKKLLEVVRCNCTNCASPLCSCRKHGLNCSTGCGQCRGICANGTTLEEDETHE